MAVSEEAHVISFPKSKSWSSEGGSEGLGENGVSCICKSHAGRKFDAASGSVLTHGSVNTRLSPVFLPYWMITWRWCECLIKSFSIHRQIRFCASFQANKYNALSTSGERCLHQGLKRIYPHLRPPLARHFPWLCVRLVLRFDYDRLIEHEIAWISKPWPYRRSWGLLV